MSSMPAEPVALGNSGSIDKDGGDNPVSAGFPGSVLGHRDVSVVVPTYRRPAMLARCLEALIAQDIDAERFEILVCDDGPDDATRELVERLRVEQAERGLEIRYLAVTRTQGPAGARNAGWRAARAPVVAFTDDDTVPDPHWLQAGIAALENGAAAAAGTIVVPLPDRPTDYEADASGLAQTEFATANAFVVRTFLVMTGGFDERYTAAWREDSDLQFTLMDVGGQVIRAPDAVVIHPVRPGRWGVSIAQQKKSQFDALLYKKHPTFFRARIRARPPLLYYAILCMALLALSAAFAGDAVAASIGIVGWFLLTAFFCAVRLRGRNRSARHIAEMAWTSMCIPFLSIFWRLYGAVRFKVLFL